MAELSDLSLRYRARLALYHWHHAPVAWTPLRVPLAQARVALVTMAGYYHPDADAPFLRIPGGDCSFRVLPDDVAVAELTLGQTSSAFDRAPALADPNVAFPLDRLHALVAAGEVGAAAPRHLSFNGSITAPRPLVRDFAPAAAELLKEDEVDAALLVPI